MSRINELLNESKPNKKQLTAFGTSVAQSLLDDVYYKVKEGSEGVVLSREEEAILYSVIYKVLKKESAEKVKRYKGAN